MKIFLGPLIHNEILYEAVRSTYFSFFILPFHFYFCYFSLSASSIYFLALPPNPRIPRYFLVCFHLPFLLLPSFNSAPFQLLFSSVLSGYSQSHFYSLLFLFGFFPVSFPLFPSYFSFSQGHC